MSDILELGKAVNEKCQSKDGSVDHRYWAFRSVELLPALIAETERLRSAPKSGLYGKYIIQKADGSTVDPKADYFILRLDTDPYARIAALEYAIQTDDQNLGKQLEARVFDHVFSPDDQCRARADAWPLGMIKRMEAEVAAKDARIKELEAIVDFKSNSAEHWYKEYMTVYKIKRTADNDRLTRILEEKEAYIKRLEAAFLKARQCPTCKGEGTIHPIGQPIDSICPKCLGDPESMAREALERIKEEREG